MTYFVDFYPPTSAECMMKTTNFIIFVSFPPYRLSVTFTSLTYLLSSHVARLICLMYRTSVDQASFFTLFYL